ncbi:MAG TPA: DGQHR domain-containing protein [Rhizomicrobium sp.]|nr:DGQHR domain-containing protein [Rhizomicrobium sp.]
MSGFIPAGALIPNHYEIPHHDPRTKKGYQRPPQESRINELVADLRKERVDLPTAILLNIRNKDARHGLADGHLDLNALRATDAHFYVVDGQHRILALKKLIGEFDVDYRWSKFMLPFVCMIGATEEQEMDQFYVVNSKAKSVRTDLALLILRQRAERDDKVYEALLERGKDWQVEAQKVVETLAAESSVWRGRIRLPAMEKADTTIPSASMVSSLKPLLASPYFGQLGFDQQLKVLDAFWRGIREVMRPAFDDPTEFSIQKGVGVIVLHAVLLHILEIVRSKGLSVVEPEAFSQVLKKPLESLQGDDARGSPVSGLDFWRGAPNGAAGSYSSSAGRRVLIAKLRQLLPQVEAV